MELSYLLFTGSLSGLVSILGHSVIWSAVELAQKRPQGTHSLQVQISEAFFHMMLGIALGLMFWLSWGFAAIVQVSWWVRGLSFAGVAALLFAPALLNMLASRRLSAQLLMVFASRWLTTCLLAGLACAWSWEQTP
jgi:hypothetical protein